MPTRDIINTFHNLATPFFIVAANKLEEGLRVRLRYEVYGISLTQNTALPIDFKRSSANEFIVNTFLNRIVPGSSIRGLRGKINPIIAAFADEEEIDERSVSSPEPIKSTYNDPEPFVCRAIGEDRSFVFQKSVSVEVSRSNIFTTSLPIRNYGGSTGSVTEYSQTPDYNIRLSTYFTTQRSYEAFVSWFETQKSFNVVNIELNETYKVNRIRLKSFSSGDYIIGGKVGGEELKYRHNVSITAESESLRQDDFVVISSPADEAPPPADLGDEDADLFFPGFY